MKNSFFLCLFCFFASLSCEYFDGVPVTAAVPAGNVRTDSSDWAAYGIRTHAPAESYDQTRAAIRKLKSDLRDAHRTQKIDLDSVGRVFTDVIVNRLLPYWYGTPWSFEGHTEVPGTGRIACGYLVSTTLLHAGVRLNRYKLAQQAPSGEAATLALGDSVMLFRGTWTRVVLPKLMSTLPDGLYFIGLDGSHVGYLLRRRDRFFLLHSNYTYPALVRIEPAGERSVLSSFSTFYMVPVSGNRKLLEAWLYEREVAILKG